MRRQSRISSQIKRSASVNVSRCSRALIGFKIFVYFVWHSRVRAFQNGSQRMVKGQENARREGSPCCKPETACFARHWKHLSPETLLIEFPARISYRAYCTRSLLDRNKLKKPIGRNCGHCVRRLANGGGGGAKFIQAHTKCRPPRSTKLRRKFPRIIFRDEAAPRVFNSGPQLADDGHRRESGIRCLRADEIIERESAREFPTRYIKELKEQNNDM